MKKLSADSFKKVSQYITENARPLEKRIFEYYFNNGNSLEIINELEKFQNSDGGFGNGLEADFRLPLSSPMATSVAFNHLIKYADNEKAYDIIKSGIKYFEKTFVANENRWFVVPKEVNNFPHAPWWHYLEREGMTIIDRNWGNPSSEIISYLYKYKDFVSTLNVEELLNYAIDYFLNKDEFKAESEVYCYIRLFELLPDTLAKKIENKLTFAVQSTICDKREEWDKYVPQPLHFINNPKSNRFGISNDLIEENLDYLIDTIESNGKINPPWNWHNLKSMIDPNWNWDDYNSKWEIAKKEWTSILTLKALIALNNFKRIEMIN